MSTAELTLIEEIPSVLAKSEALKDLSPDSVASLVKSFTPHFKSFYELVNEARAIQPDMPKAAGKMRLKIREIRLDAEETRKTLKADSLRRGKSIDSINNLLLHDLVPVEDSLTSIEKAEERREMARINIIAETRKAALTPYIDVTFYDLGNMPESQYNQLFESSKLAHEAKLAAVAKIEADRIAAEKAAEEARVKKEAENAAARAKLEAENTRLAKVAEEARRITLETQKRAIADRQAAEKKAADEKKIADEKAAKEREIQDAANKKAEEERKAVADKAAKEKADLEAKAKAIQAKLDAQKAAEEKRIKDEKATEAEKMRIAKVEAQKAAAAPDREKLKAFSATLRAIKAPALSNAALQTKIDEQMKKFAIWVDGEALKL